MLALAALAFAALLWDIVQAGHIAQQRRTPPVLAMMAGLVVLLAAPALLVAVATNAAIGGYSVGGAAWIWPATAAVFVAESMYVTLRRLVTPFVGIPIALYNGLLLVVAVTRYLQETGGAPPAWSLAFSAAYTDALSAVAGPVVLTSPWATLVPLIAPAFPVRRASSRIARAGMTALATASITALIAWSPAGERAVRSYDRYLNDVLQERPAGDFAIGVQILPPIDGMPPATALRYDLALVDTIGAEVIGITVDLDGSRATVLDSLARALEPVRRDSTSVIITLGSGRAMSLGFATTPPSAARRIAALGSIARRLRPDYLVIGPDPARTADAGRLVPPYAYLTAAADSIHAIDHRIKVVVAVSTSNERDSALYAWAMAPSSPVDAVGFRLFPSLAGAPGLDAWTGTADRWMVHVSAQPKEQWVLAAGGFPMVHGEEAQQLAIWRALSWATGRSTIKGLIVSSSADYGDITGLRAPNGRLRPAAIAVMRAAKELRERRN